MKKYFFLLLAFTVTHLSAQSSPPSRVKKVTKVSYALEEIYGYKNGQDASIAIQKAINDGIDISFKPNTIYPCRQKILFNRTGGRYTGNNSTLEFNPIANALEDIAISRLADISGNDNTFDGLIFSGGGNQPRTGLVYVDSNTLAPKFQRCVFENIVGVRSGSNTMNQTSGLLINLYGVTDLLIENCTFRNMNKFNDGQPHTQRGFNFINPIAVGVGFMDALLFFNEDLTNPLALQTTPTNGRIRSCSFDNITTTLDNAQLNNPNYVALYDDAEGIRTYSQAGTGSGAEYCKLLIENCTFSKCSKRALKLRAMGTVAKNNIVYTHLNKHRMSTVFDIVSNNTIDGMEIYGNSNMYPMLVGYYQPSGNENQYNTLVKNIDCNFSANGFYFYGNSFNAGITNLTLSNLRFSNVKYIGIAHLPTPLVSNLSNILLEKINISATGDSCIGLQLDGGLVNVNYTLKDITLRNANAKIVGGGCTVQKLAITVDNPNFVANNIGSAVFYCGGTLAQSRNTFEDVSVKIDAIPRNFLSAIRSFMDFNSSNSDYKNIKLTVADAVRDASTFWQFNISASNSRFRGFEFNSKGNGYLSTTVAVKNLEMEDFSRTGATNSTDNFIYGGHKKNARVALKNFIDYRPTNTNNINIIAGDSTTIDGLTTNTTNENPVIGVANPKKKNIRKFSTTTLPNAMPPVVVDTSVVSSSKTLPRLTTKQRNAIISPTKGFEIYNITLNKKQVYTGSKWKTVPSN